MRDRVNGMLSLAENVNKVVFYNVVDDSLVRNEVEIKTEIRKRPAVPPKPKRIINSNTSKLCLDL